MRNGRITLSPDNQVVLYEPRTYRDPCNSARFVTFRVRVDTSDLYVRASRQLVRETETLIRRCRSWIEEAIERRREFLSSLEPLEEHEADHPVTCHMVRAGRRAGAGPMAAVAGAVADFVGRGLLQHSREVIVENGGDIFLKVDEPILVGLHAGDSPFTGTVAIRVGPSPIPLGLCTSSGVIGHSKSLGKAHAATVISRDVPLADAVATAMGNRITRAADLKSSVEWAVSLSGVQAAVAIMGDTISVQGQVELVPVGAACASDGNPRKSRAGT
jgi:hypothetical protein